MAESVAVHGQRAAGRHAMLPGRAHDQRVAAAHLLMQQPDGVMFRVVGTEGIGTDQFSQPIRLMGVGFAHGPHLVQDDGHSGARKLPGRLRPGQAAADDVDGFDVAGHGQQIEAREGAVNAPAQLSAGWRHGATGLSFINRNGIGILHRPGG